MYKSLALAARAGKERRPNITRAALVNVFFKLTLSHLWAIEAASCKSPSTTAIERVLAHCPHCEGPLTDKTQRMTHAFFYARGRVPVTYAEHPCARCIRDHPWKFPIANRKKRE